MTRTIRNASSAAVLALLIAATPALAQKTRGGDERRAYYQTVALFDGAQALNACAAGFHMASIDELLDFGALKYDATLGVNYGDSHSGATLHGFGWVRTASQSSNEMEPGRGNCLGWTSNLATDYGTGIFLEWNWVNPNPTPIAPWRAYAFACSTQTRVWCVQD